MTNCIDKGKKHERMAGIWRSGVRNNSSLRKHVLPHNLKRDLQRNYSNDIDSSELIVVVVQKA